MKMNPVYKREMTLSSRSVKLSILVLAFNILLAAAALINMYLMLEDVKMTSEVRYSAFLELYVMVSSIEFLLIILIIPAMTAGSISAERERQTLDLMLTTKMRPLDIVFGKLISSFDTIFMLVLSSFPILSLVFIFGGVRLSDLFILLVMFYSTAVFVGSLSIWLSALVKRTSVAMVLSYALLAAIIAGTIGINVAAFYIQSMRYSELSNQVGYNVGKLIYIMILNPAVTFYGLINVQAGNGNAVLNFVNQFGHYEPDFVIRHWIGISGAVQAGFSLLFFSLAVHRVNPLARGKRISR